MTLTPLIPFEIMSRDQAKNLGKDRVMMCHGLNLLCFQCFLDNYIV
ncbi:MAG: hypothetical protein ACI87H_002533, partial [Gammaproteobacteria bacterium]